MQIKVYMRKPDMELFERLVAYYQSAEPFEPVSGSWVVRKGLRELAWQVFGRDWVEKDEEA